MKKKATARCAFPVCSGRSTFPRSPQPNGVIRTRSFTCPWNMQLTSPSLIIWFAQQTERGPLSTAPRHDDPLSRHRLSYYAAAGAAAKTRERSSSSARDIPYPSPRPIAWLKRCGCPGPDLPQLLPMEWPDGVDGRVTMSYSRDISPMWYDVAHEQLEVEWDEDAITEGHVRWPCQRQRLNLRFRHQLESSSCSCYQRHR